MANQTKQYFLAPTWDYPPNGPLALGNIILSPARPVPPLLPSNTLPTPLISTTTKANVHWSHSTTSSHHLGIWTKFIDLLSLKLGFDASRTSSDIFRFESMRTEEFFPSEAFLSAALGDPAVRRRVGRLGKAVYVIVGVKTVTGAQVKRERSVRGGAQLEVEVDAAQLAGSVSGVPVTVGPAGAARWEGREQTGFEGSDEFVFAYRVLKVWVTGGGRGVGQKEYVKGAMLGERSSGENGDGGDELGGEVVVETLADEELGGGWESSRVVEGEEGEVQVFVPRIEI